MLAEAEALQLTKELHATGRHRAHASMPVYRLFGPLVEVAINAGINFYSLLRRPPRYAPVINELWPESHNYPPEV